MKRHQLPPRGHLRGERELEANLVQLALRPQLLPDSEARGHDSHAAQVEGFTYPGLDLSPCLSSATNNPPTPPPRTPALGSATRLRHG